VNSDYGKRDYLLPEGCKDLIDTIKLRGLGPAGGPAAPGQPTELLISEPILVNQLAALLGQDVQRIIADLMQVGVFAKADQPLDFEAISKVVRRYGLTAKLVSPPDAPSGGN
jgi:hypothetical protein